MAQTYERLNYSDWSERLASIIENIRSGEPKGITGLSEQFSPVLILILSRQYHSARVEVVVDETLRQVAQSIKDDPAIDANALPRLVLRIARRLALVLPPNELQCTPSDKDEVEIVRNIMIDVPEIQQRALTMYYVENLAADSICEAVGLSCTAFSVLRSTLRLRFRAALIDKRACAKSSGHPTQARIEQKSS